MLSKPKVLFCYLAYPFALASYFRQAFERRQDIDLFTCGAYTGSYIPWNGGINLPSKYVYPVNLALPADVLFPSWEMVRPQLGFTPDLVVQVDAGWHFKNRPQVEKVVTVATDPHVLNYDVPRSYSDYFFNMQAYYSKPNDIYLPYAADKKHHYPSLEAVEYDACLIGLHYPQRNNLVQYLREGRYKVYYDIGLIYDEYREMNCKATVGLNWSSLQDLPARVFEIMAMERVCLTNRGIPDLPTLFEEGKHYLAFDNVNEARDKMDWVRDNPDAAKDIARNGYEIVMEKHTYDHRVQTILETAGVI